MNTRVSFLFKLKRFNILSTRHINCWVAAITRTHRTLYLKKYPTLLQHPDGSTINIRYHEPIGVIKLPLNLNELLPEERKLRLEKRYPKMKKAVEKEDDIEDVGYDETRYLKQ